MGPTPHRTVHRSAAAGVTPAPHTFPTTLARFTGVIQIALGPAVACVRAGDGALACSGGNVGGALGDVSFESSWGSPARVAF